VKEPPWFYLLEEPPQDNPLLSLEDDVGHVLVDFFVLLPQLAPETHGMQPTMKQREVKT
jgi:hypothetical protein